MKKYILVMLVVLGHPAFAQNQVQQRNMTTLAKVWGFLKYYHSSVAEGQPEWDGELIRLIRLTNQPEMDFKKTLSAWYYTLPGAKVADQPVVYKADSIVPVFRRRDIYGFKLTNDLTVALLHLYDYHLPDSNVYVTNRYKQYTLDYLLNTEEVYAEEIYPSPEMRLLALCRFWNIINYQYPHKRKTPTRWNTVLTRYIPLFYAAANKNEYRRVIKSLSAEMEDSHAFYRDADTDESQQWHTSFELIRFKGRYYVYTLNNQMLADAEGICRGDEIIAINGMGIKPYEKQYLSAVKGSNRNSTARDLARQLFKADTLKKYTITIRRAAKYFSLIISRYPFSQLTAPQSGQTTVSSPGWKEVAPGIWYVAFCRINNQADLKPLFAAIQHARGVIWDMRGYPSYPLLDQVFASLMPEKVNLGYNTNASICHIGQFTRTESVYTPMAPLYPVYTGKMIVLADASTQSLAESVSAQLRLRPHTLIMGSQTAGTTGNVNYFTMPGGIKTSFTAVGFEGAAGSFTQKKGVKIDIHIRKTLTEIKRGEDLLPVKAARAFRADRSDEGWGVIKPLLRRIGLW